MKVYKWNYSSISTEVLVIDDDGSVTLYIIVKPSKNAESIFHYPLTIVEKGKWEGYFKHSAYLVPPTTDKRWKLVGKDESKSLCDKIFKKVVETTVEIVEKA